MFLAFNESNTCLAQQVTRTSSDLVRLRLLQLNVNDSSIKEIKEVHAEISYRIHH